MARHHLIPGATILSIAFILSLLVSISLPYVRAFDIVRVTFGTGTVGADDAHIDQFRWGIWGRCFQLAGSGSWDCLTAGHAYSSEVGGQTIGSSWTRGLVIHPIATAVILVALLLSFSTHLTVTLVASLMCFLGAVLTLIAFSIDIALFAYVKSKMNNIPDVQENTQPGPAFWMTLVVLILTSVAGCTVCFCRRRHQNANGESYKLSSRRPWYNKFRRGH